MTRTRKRQTPAQRELAAKQAAAKAWHLDRCEHPSHWLDTPKGAVRCQCWRAAEHAARQVQEEQANG